MPLDYSSDLTKVSAWHDMKTILTAVQAGLAVLEKDTSDMDLLDNIRLGVTKALELAKNSQESYASSFTDTAVNTDLQCCLESIINVFTPLAEYHGVTIIYKKINSNVLISTPKGVVEQIFINLLSNAIKFSVSKIVTITVTHEDAASFTMSSDFSDIDQVLKLFTITKKTNDNNSFNIGVPSMQNLLNIYGGELLVSNSEPIYLSVILP